MGCGYGASAILMAQAFPKSQFVAIDYHESSILVARERAKQAGVASARRRFVGFKKEPTSPAVIIPCALERLAAWSQGSPCHFPGVE